MSLKTSSSYSSPSHSFTMFTFATSALNAVSSLSYPSYLTPSLCHRDTFLPTWTLCLSLTASRRMTTQLCRTPSSLQLDEAGAPGYGARSETGKEGFYPDQTLASNMAGMISFLWSYMCCLITTGSIALAALAFSPHLILTS